MAKPTHAQLVARLAAEQVRAEEAERQHSAASAVLLAVGGGGRDLPGVLRTIAESAARVCGCDDAVIRLVEGDRSRTVAGCGPIGAQFRGDPTPAETESVGGRAIAERRSVAVADVLAAAHEYPYNARHAERGLRSIAAVPLLRDGVAVGVVIVHRPFVRPFAEREVELLEGFAAQAVVAIENARLFSELNQRNTQLTEALEQQNATAEVLQAISRAPTARQEVLDTIAESAGRLCGGVSGLVWSIEGDTIHRLAAWRGPGDETHGRDVGEIRPLAGTLIERTLQTRRTAYVPDLAALPADELPATPARRGATRTLAAAPLLRQGEPIGALVVSAREPGALTDRQLQLLETFADQAVIAIENSRLFEELQERLAEQTATGEILRAIGASPTDASGVLRRIVDTAGGLVPGLSFALISAVVDGQPMRAEAVWASAEYAASERLLPPDRPPADADRVGPSPGAPNVDALAVERGRTVYVTDLAAVPADELGHPNARRRGVRTLASFPLRHGDRVFGTLDVASTTPDALSPAQIALLESFADQAAIAVQNARLYEVLAEKSRQLEEASQHKSEFLANMSHELRTPLNAVIGFTEVLLEKYFGEVNEKQEEYLNDILSSGQHLLALINDILDLSKVEAGRMELELSTFDVEHTLQGGLVMLKERAQKSGVQLELAVHPATGRVEADERKVKQVVFNLLSNAVKFTPNGGRVDMSAWRELGCVYVAVRDTGVGIAPEEQRKVFEEFGQARSGRAQSEGTGLGLALVKRFVELHGGEVTLESELGKGSTFTVSLPVRSRAGA